MSTQMGRQERMHDNSSWIFGTSAQLEVKLINIMCLTRHIPKYESRRQPLIKNMSWTKIKIKYKEEKKCEAHMWINLTKFFTLHSKFNLWLSFSFDCSISMSEICKNCCYKCYELLMVSFPLCALTCSCGDNLQGEKGIHSGLLSAAQVKIRHQIFNFKCSN